ncbi:MAG: hypothetical protein JWQ72_3971, partial [Polaromonas sp.]|nr:hypothetical protein [Polaromonas sp.]
MTDLVHPLPKRRLLGYWWAPVMVLAVVLAVLAYLRPYQALELSDLPPAILASATTLDQAFGAPVRHAIKYSTRRTYSSPTGPMEVEIRVALHPMGFGLVAREDDWYYVKGHTVVYQERFILFRNLFSLHTRSREVAPFVHDLMGRAGWYNDSTQTMTPRLSGGTPESPGWTLDLATDRVSDTDGKGLLLQTTAYQRNLHCERAGQLDGADIGASF